MEWQFLVALMVAVPLILLPAAIIRYTNAGGWLRRLWKQVGRSKNEERSGGA